MKLSQFWGAAREKGVNHPAGWENYPFGLASDATWQTKVRALSRHSERRLPVTTAALIVAAGRGTRAAGPRPSQVPKQYAQLGATSVLAHTLGVFLEHPAVEVAVVAIAEADRARYERAGVRGHPKLATPVLGGATRQGSVLIGLRALAPLSPTRVLIHDAARPFVTGDIVDRVLAALQHSPGAIAAVPLADTLKRAGADG